MRSLRFLPVVYIVGVHGFALFVPYALGVGAIALLVAHVKRLRTA
jgi:hypothetical protein